MIDQETAVLICGVDNPNAPVDELLTLTDALRTVAPDSGISCVSFGDTGDAVRTEIESLASGPAKTIVCVPAALSATGPVKNMLPDLINRFATERADLNLIYARELGIDPRLLRVASERIVAAEAKAGNDVPREETLAMIVGVGSGEEDADSDLGKVGRLLWEGMGFGWAETCFTQDGFPSVEQAFAKVTRLGYRRIIVLPYVLFGGDKVTAINDQVGAADTGDAEVLMADHLGPDTAVAEIIMERVAEALRGDNNMNCQMCSYREQVIAGVNHHGDHHHHHKHNHDHHHGDAG